MAISVKKYESTKETHTSLSDVRGSTLEAARNAPESGMELTVALDHGVYTLTEPFVLDAAEEPALARVKLHLTAAKSMRPTVSSAVTITEEYERVEGKPYFKCQLSKDENGEYPRFRDVYYQGKRLKMATSPIWLNKEALTAEERGAGHYDGDGTWMCNDFEAPVDRRGLYVPIETAKQVAASESDATELCMYVQWEHYTLRVTGVDLSDTKEIEGETYALVTFDENFVPYFVHGIHICNNTMNRITFFRNDLAFLTEKDTFVYDHKSGVLYFIVDELGLGWRYKLSRPTLDTLFVIKGMKDVTVEGLVFTGVSSSYACDKGYYALLSNVERRLNDLKGDRLRQGAIVTENVKNLTVKDCEFRGVGCNAVQMCDRTLRAAVRDCIFVDIAMSAVSVGNPTRRWDIPENRSYAVSVINNYMEHIAYDYPNAAAIYLGVCDGAKILRNTIKGCGYSGLYGGWGWSTVHYEAGESVNVRNAEVAYNRISDFMELCRDGAAIYMTGGNATLACEERFNSIHHNFAFLAESGHMDKRGYYLDGAASHYDVYDNVIDNCALPLFTQYHVPSQFTHHNHVWNFYSTTPVDPENHKPYNDVLLTNCCVETAGLAALFEKYPEAKAIADAAGCTLSIQGEKR